MSSKTPFEVRLDLLKMAKEMLDQSYHSQYEIAKEYFSRSAEVGKDYASVVDQYLPKMYNPIDIMEKANELYSFVTKKD